MGTLRDVSSGKGQIVPIFSFVASVVRVAAALLSLRITVFWGLFPLEVD